MAGICFLIALLLGAAGFLFWQAADQISIGTQWASDVCSLSSTFCHNPEYLGYADDPNLATFGSDIFNQ